MKTCTKCNIPKDYSLFRIKSDRKSGYASHCKDCEKKHRELNKIKLQQYQSIYRLNNKYVISEKNKAYKSLNRDVISEKNKEYYLNNKDVISEKNKEYYLCNKDVIDTKHKLYYVDNKDKYKEYYNNNKNIINEYTKIYNKLRRKTDILFKLRGNIRSLILRSFKNNSITKNTKSVNILGCTVEEFKVYLESKFDDKMNWENQGSYWHMDHIKPVSLATNEKELIELNHYTNFQPLEKYENLSKSNKY